MNDQIATEMRLWALETLVCSDASRIRHDVFEMVMARVAAIACGHEDAIDLDRLRHDPPSAAVIEYVDRSARLDTVMKVLS